MTTATVPHARRIAATQRAAGARRGIAAVATVTALLLTGACGSLGAKSVPAQPIKASKSESGAQGTAVDDKPAPNAKLAELQGADGAVLTVTSAERKEGGFLTVKGRMTNTTDKALNPMAWVAGTELVSKNPYSIAGATLADQQGGKRYYILRDTDGLCLCTAFGPVFPANRTVPVFMQFPAPPQEVREVDLTVPTFDTVAIRITG